MEHTPSSSPFLLPPPVVSQVDAENILQLSAQIERDIELRDRIQEEVLRKIQAGREVESGRRTVRVETEYKNGVCTQRLVVR